MTTKQAPASAARLSKQAILFFANAEMTRKQEPTFYNAGDPGAAITVADAQSITNFLKANYNYDPGTYALQHIHQQ